MDLESFLPALTNGLNRFQQRIKTDDSPDRVVKVLPGIERVNHDEVAVGIGKFELPTPGELWSGGICLNNKAAGFGCVTDLVLNAPADLLEGWRTVIDNNASPEAFFERFNLIVEDASPDSCFGLLCLLMRLAGMTKESIPQQWVKYVEAWELGETPSSESIYSAYGCLHNALVHAKIDNDPAGAWIDGLRFMAEALASGEQPAALPMSLPSSLLSRAHALLRFEEQKYEESLEHATCVQLALPIVETKDRYRLIDAYLAPETALPSGTLKVFCRAESKRPFLRNGFTLMAVYRPKPVGDGDDMTISVDPAASVDLKELWANLEKAEDEAWGGPDRRPHNDPRNGVIGYPDKKRPDGRDAPNQPWWSGFDYTLVASPKMIRNKDGKLLFGSKLEWQEVLEQVWQTYQPFRHVRVCPYPNPMAADSSADANLKSLEECYPLPLSDDLTEGIDLRDSDNFPLLFVAGWHRPDNSSPAFNITPTLCKYLASCIERWRPSMPAGPVKLKELSDESAYDVFRSPGLVSIVGERGAFLVYDQQRFMPPLADIKNEFVRAARIKQRILQGTEDLKTFLDDIKAFFAGRRPDLLEEDLLERLTNDQIEIALELHSAHTDVVPHLARRFREALLARWGIESWLDALARDISQIKNVLYGRADLDNARRVAFLHKYGVPAALAAVLYGFVVELGTLWRWPPNPSGIKWSGLAILILLALVIFTVMQSVRVLRRRARLKSMLSLPLRSFRVNTRSTPYG